MTANAVCSSLYLPVLHTKAFSRWIRWCETYLSLPPGCGRLLFNKPTKKDMLLVEDVCPTLSGILSQLEWSELHGKFSFWSHLLHGCVTADELLPEVSDVVVASLHVLLKVLSECQEGLLHFTLELHRKQTRFQPIERMYKTTFSPFLLWLETLQSMKAFLFCASWYLTSKKIKIMLLFLVFNVTCRGKKNNSTLWRLN